MPFRFPQIKPDKSAGPIRRALQYAFYDWTRDMPAGKRVLALVGFFTQAIAFDAAMLAHNHRLTYLIAPAIWLLGMCLLSGALTSEFVRKTQLESEQIAAQQIQQTLHAHTLEPVQGYELQTFYQPFRDVGGDYFDVIELPGNRTLFAMADVSGKGMPAALLAANIQALVRSIANTEADPLAFARQINKHLSRYTPADRFATALFIVLSRDSGELTYVNAGHNAPIVSSSGSTTFLEATGIPLGLFSDTMYEVRTAVLRPRGALLLFTDGLTDSIAGNNPENRLRDALADTTGRRMSLLKTLIDPESNEDDVTILLIEHTADLPSSSAHRREGGIQTYQPS